MSNLTIQVIDCPGDKSCNNLCLRICLVELILIDVGLVNRNIEMALDLLTRAKRNVEEPAFVLKGMAPMPLCDVAHTRHSRCLYLAAERIVSTEGLIFGQAIYELYQFTSLLPALQVFEPLYAHRSSR